MKKSATLTITCLLWLLVMAGGLQTMQAASLPGPTGAGNAAKTTAATINGSIDVCVGQSIAYTCSDNTGFSYTWNAFNGAGVPSVVNSFTVLWNSVGTGTVTVVVKDNLGNVINTATQTVTVHALPVPLISSSVVLGCGGGKSGSPQHDKDECLAACDSSYVTYTTPLHAGSTYTWNITGEISYSASGNSVTVHWGGIGAGTVSVTETDVWGCTGTDELCIKIVGTPKALFTTLPPAVGGIINACLNQTVQFINQSTPGSGSNITGYQWYFGDGGQSILVNPTHQYTTAGTYTITLIAENECHCKDTFKQTIIISSSPGPDISCPSTVCAGATSTYTTSAVCSVYNWSVTGGTINQLPPYGNTITVTWGSTGPGIVSLNVGTCGGYCPSTTSIIIPIISPTTTISGPANPCVGMSTYSINYIPGCTYTWTVPSGATIIGSDSGSQIDVYFPSDTITGTITVTYYNPTLKCGGTGTLLISVKPSFYVMGPTIACTNTTYTYSTSGAGTFNWVIKDNLGNTVQTVSGPSSINVNWTYGPGTFTITVTNPANQYCNSPQVITVQVNPSPAAPTAVFGPNPVCPGGSYSYSAVPSGANYLLWNITNGTPSSTTGNNVTITWGLTGPYVINLYQVSIGQQPCTSAVYTYVVNPMVVSPAPISGPASVCNNTVQNYSTTATADQYTWSVSPATFGSVINGQGTNNATVQWNNSSGTATVTLAIQVCNTTVISTYNVTLGVPPPPVINAPASACERIAVSFSTPTSASSYYWDFGDGNTSTLQNPQHTYNSTGTFNVTLTVTNPGGCLGTYTSVWLINIRPTPIANITTTSPNYFCTGQAISTAMYGTGLVLGNTYQWLQNGSSSGMPTGTAYTATTTGSYSLVVSNTFGCSDTSNVINVNQGPCDTCSIKLPAYSGFTWTLNSPSCNTVSFSGFLGAGGISPSWNFDDPLSGGSNTATGLTPTHSFTNAGFYRVVLSGMFPNKWNTGYCRKDTMAVVRIPVIADFLYTLSCGSTPGTFNVQFTDNSSKAQGVNITSWSWSITGATSASSSLQNPLLTLNPGSHTITFTVNPSGGPTCTITRNITIPNVATAVIGASSQICFGNTIGFSSASSLGNITGIYWDFGDASSSLIANPSRTYGAPGTYTVILTVTDAYGCTDTAHKIITVSPNTLGGNITAGGPLVFCEGNNVTLTANPTGGTPAYSYLWSNVQTTASILATQTGFYYVDLTDSKGCKYRTPSINVIVNPKPYAQIIGATDYCLYDNIFLSADQGSMNTYQWYVNGNPYTTGPNFYQYAGSTGTFNIMVVITSPNGCADTANAVIKVHPNPAPPVITPSSTPTCAGTPVTLTASGAANYTWSTGATTAAITVVNPGPYTVSTQNIFGCKSETTISVNPLPDFSTLMSGCYEFCDTINVPLLGPTGPGYTYQWYLNGNPISGATGPNYTVPAGASGVYTLQITTGSGCTSTSKDIDINFVHCGDCSEIIANITNIQCTGVDGSGNQTYSFTMTINNPFGSGTTYVMSSPQGVLSGVSPSLLAAGTNTITGTFTDMPAPDVQLCIYGYVVGPQGKRCEFKACKNLPECNQEPCDATVSFSNLVCIGQSGGNNQYYFSLNVNWVGSNGSTITITSPQGSVGSLNTTTVNAGSNTVTGVFTDLPAPDVQLCLTIYIYDPVTHLTCIKRVCKKLPECPQEHCEPTVYVACPNCLERTSTGNWTYQFNFNVYNPTGSNMNILLTSPNGGFGIPSPSVAAPGNNPVSVVFTDLGPADSLVCFTVILQNPQTGMVCSQTACIKLPDCRKLGVGDIAASESRLINIYPNPASNHATIEHIFDDLESRKITVTDVTGRHIQVFENVQGIGKVEIDTDALADGMYIVNIYEHGKKAGFRRLIVVRN